MNQAQKPISAQDDLIGRVINDRFRILGVIARGGMGRVYRAEQVPLGRLVALKTLDPRAQTGDGDPQFQQRFFLEASVASKLQHPNTVTVFDYGRTADGIYFIAMELVEGRSLLSLVREEGAMPGHRVVHIALQIARSLREAHRLDVIHRDLKPGNVLLTRHGDEEDFVKVLDFGLVKHVETPQEQELTKAGLFMGSPKYMSPEQIRGERVDARSDIYALGVVMYEMLCGHVPFDRENTVKVLMAHMHEQPAPIDNPDLTPALRELVHRCLAKSPDARPSSMDEVILLLKQSTGATLLMSGAFPLSQEMRLPPSIMMGSLPPLRTSSGTPTQAQAFGGVLPQVATPYGGYSTSGLVPSGTTQRGSIPAPAVSVGPVAVPASNWLPRLAVLGALLISGGFLALRFSERREVPKQTVPVAPVVVEPAPVTAPPPQPSPVPEPAAKAPAPAPAPEAQRLVISLASIPNGAYVEVAGKTFGPTPAEVELWGDEATLGREVTFVFTKPGFLETKVIRKIVESRLELSVTLPMKRREPVHREPHGPVVIPDNFKDDPY